MYSICNLITITERLVIINGLFLINFKWSVGTTDFDNSSRLITLSAIIISGLHCITKAADIHSHYSEWMSVPLVIQHAERMRRIILPSVACPAVDCVWNVMAHAQKPHFVFRRNGRVHLNRWGRQFSRLLAAGVCASAVVMLDTPCSEVVWRVLATHSILQFPLHFPSRASPCAITFQLDSPHFSTLLHTCYGFRGKKTYWTLNVFWFSLKTFECNISHSKKNSARYS
jgi:hypothetical protein